MEKGWILAPNETEKSLLERKETFSQVSLPKEKNLSVSIYDFHDLEACILYENRSLFPWQGAVLWEYQTLQGKKYPVIQLRKSFSNMPKKEEILQHELVHAARSAFNEPFFEEMFAYQTSSSALRRIFGPIFIYPFESAFFALACLATPFLSIYFDSFIGTWLLLSLTFFLLTRLLFLHGFFILCKRTLKKAGVLPNFSLAVMVRLSDKEIIKTALSSPKNALKYFKKKGSKEIRFQQILLSYFHKS